MSRRLVWLFAVGASLAVWVGPAAATDVVHYQDVGSGVNVGVSNLEWNPDTGWLLPGTYEGWGVAAGRDVDTSGDQALACASYMKLTVGDFNQVYEVRSASGCGPYEAYDVNPSGIAGHAAATVPVTACTDNDPDPGWDCGSLGAFTFDVTVIARGPIDMAPGRNKSAGALVTPGQWTESWHQMQLSRFDASVTGTFSLDGFGPLALGGPGTTSQVYRIKATATDVYR